MRSINASEDLPPMAAGVFGYLGYDMVRQMEDLGPPKLDPIGVPDAIMLRPTVMVVFDAVKEEIFVVTPLRPAPGVGFRAAYDRALERIEAVTATLEGSLAREALGANPYLATVPPRSNTEEKRFHAMVERAKDYIRAGDIFQVVLSQRFSAPFALPAFALYRALRRVNPSPFLCYLDFGPFQIVCSSPEISDEPHRPRILPSLVAEASPTSEDGGGPNAQAMKPSKRRAPKAAAGLAPPQTRARRRNDTAQPARTLVSETNAAPAQEHPTKQRDRAAAPRPNGIGLSSEPAAAVANGAALEANTPPDPDRKHRASRTRILLKRGRNTAAALPAGQHWKRRLHPRSW